MAFNVYPNPAQDQLTIEFKSTESLAALPEAIYLYHESSTNPVRSVSVQEVFDRKAFTAGNKLLLEVGDLPRGTYYLHVLKTGEDKQLKRIILE